MRPATAKGTDFVIDADGRLARSNGAPDGLIYAGAAIVASAHLCRARQSSRSRSTSISIAPSRRPALRHGDGRPLDHGRHARRHPARRAGHRRSDAARIVTAGRFPRVLSIPAGAPFLPTLADAVLAGTLVPEFAWDGEPLTLADTTIFVPTRRAARELAQRVCRTARRALGDPAVDPPARRVRRGRRCLRCAMPARSSWRRRSRRWSGCWRWRRWCRPGRAACRAHIARNVRGGRDGAGFGRRFHLAGARSRRADRRDRDRRCRLEEARRTGVRQSRRLVAGDAGFPGDRHVASGRRRCASATAPTRPRTATR